MKKTSKALPKAQYGKVIKAAAKRAADAVVRKKEMANDLKAAAALGVGAGGWMVLDSKLRDKNKGPYSSNKSVNKTQADSLSKAKKKVGGAIKSKKK